MFSFLFLFFLFLFECGSQNLPVHLRPGKGCEPGREAVRAPLLGWEAGCCFCLGLSLSLRYTRKKNKIWKQWIHPLSPNLCSFPHWFSKNDTIYKKLNSTNIIKHIQQKNEIKTWPLFCLANTKKHCSFLHMAFGWGGGQLVQCRVFSSILNLCLWDANSTCCSDQKCL